jgi:hypothetical protein
MISNLLLLNFKAWFIAMCVLMTACSRQEIRAQLHDHKRIERDLRIITKTEKPRNYLHVDVLDDVAAHIYSELLKTCDTVFFQPYEVNGVTYKNVVGRKGVEHENTVVVGAHYDVCGDQEGADDNASGVVGMLELSRLIKKDTLDFQLEFVAYTLEEPPFFRTEQMGSYVHAKSMHEENRDVLGMICLEMIGYFDTTKGSQDYPVGALKLFYGSRGDFITVVQNYGNGSFGRKIKRGMKKQKRIETKSFKGPTSLPGIDFSDHLNYWKFDYPAVMITNTAFYRNKNYHQPSDQMETLDIGRMGLVIDQVYLTLLELKE